MIEVVKFEPSHLEVLNPLDCYKGSPGLFETVLKLNGVPGSIISTLFSIRGEMVAVFGVLSSPYAKAMSIWAITDKNVSKYPVGFHKVFKRQLKYWEEALGVVRTQSVVDVDNDQAVSQHLRCGFEIEGTMRKSGWRGQNQYILARVK